ncbi:hypothetical protein DRF62_02195 [Chryseobacterium piscium]|uniref:Uncharacterized protein n=1 Tax=Chryseobacterium piscium TaxID=333702 RepID=A0A3D9BUG2_9FLAO|nr:hypothetical protein [Chryseobacterium piscium]REC56991.1 hypothetical protein DRF62_02195 [Chryseobacterium piscium]
MEQSEREEFVKNDNAYTVQSVLNNAGKTFSQHVEGGIKTFKVYDLVIIIEGEKMILKGEGIEIPNTSKTFWKRFHQLLDIG